MDNLGGLTTKEVSLHSRLNNCITWDVKPWKAIPPNQAEDVFQPFLTNHLCSQFGHLPVEVEKKKRLKSLDVLKQT